MALELVFFVGRLSLTVIAAVELSSTGTQGTCVQHVPPPEPGLRYATARPIRVSNTLAR